MRHDNEKAPAMQGEGNDTRELNQMSDNIIPFGGQSDESPFDQIKKVREDGSEFWSARDLMPLMGYARWEDFAKITRRAITSAANSGTTEGFSEITEEGAVGRPRANFHLSRFAAYLVAMNGDPNMPEVAAAQAYFAIRTREAEVAQPVREPTLEEKALEVIGSLTKAVEAQKAENAKQSRQIEEQKPMVARMKNYQAGERDTGKQKFARDICKALREQLAVDAKFNQVYEFLSRRLRLFIAGKRSDAGDATAWAEKSFYAITDRDTNPDTGHNYSQGKLTPRGYDYAWSRIFAYAEANGHIRLEGQDVA